MSHLSDKDIDHLAREAAEQLDVDQNSSGWEALQAKLDVEMPVEKRRRRWLFFLLFPLLGAGLFLIYKTNQSPESTLTKQTNTTSRQSVPLKETPAEIVNENEDKNQVEPQVKQIDKSPAESLSKTTDVTFDDDQISDRVIIPNATLSNTETQPKNSLPSETTSPTRKSAEGNGKKNNPPADKKGLVTSTTGSMIISDATSQPPAPKTETTKNPPGIDNANSPDPLTASSVNDSLGSTTTAAVPTVDSSLDRPKAALKDSAIVASSSTKPAKKKAGNTLMPEKGFVFGLIAGPDVSKVNGTGTDERGFNAGILAGYRFNGRLSLISGVNYTHKYYTAKGSDYKPAKGTWLDTVRLSKVIGECFMFEVPVNIRYDLVAAKRNYAFVSAGLSSYFMQQEDYDFHYTTNSGYYSSRYRSYEVSDQYWFSVLNLSAGYERMLTKRLSLQVEPYLKLPLNGIGFGNMDLSSYGVFFGVRYHTGSLKAR